MNAYADDDVVPIPRPYKGLTVRHGNREVNVHEVYEGEVLYGLYDFTRDDAPEYCLGTYRLPVEEFIDRLGGHLARGDAFVFSLIDDRPQLAMKTTRGK